MKLNSKWNLLEPSERMHQLPVPIIGLTGGIATGKSTVAKTMASWGLKVISADQLIKSIYAEPETFDFIKSNYPKAIVNEKIEFPKLRELAFNDLDVRTNLENFLYKRLPDAFKKLVSIEDKIVVYDVPLLFEKKLEKLVDVSIVVYAPREMQKERLISRDGSTEEVAENILNQQIDIEEKKKVADLLVDNSKNINLLDKELDKIKKELFS